MFSEGRPYITICVCVCVHVCVGEGKWTDALSCCRRH